MRKGTFFCIDGHTCGNPVRLVTSGHPVLRGNSMSEKRQDFMANHDWIRQALMYEPRGHDMMSGAFLYPATSENADGSILFIETSGCLPMCGHGTIGTVTAAVESGLLKPNRPGQLILDTPAGQIRIEYGVIENKVDWVRLYNVPSFLAHWDLLVDVPELGRLRIDVAYGGNFYIIVEPQANFPGIEQWSAEHILKFSPLVRNAVNEAIECVHPLDSSVKGASHLLWTGKPKTDGSDAANAVFYGEKAIDRSPCGTGTSARMAQMVARGKLNIGDRFVHESLIGSQFVGKVESEAQVGPYLGINPSIQGWAKVFGQNQIVVDDDDPYHHGFQVI